MNTIQINADGMVTISQETAEERIAMARHYASQEPSQTDTPKTSLAEGEAYDAGFKGGWAAAVQETQLRFINGQLLDFYQEQGTPSYTMDGVSQVDLEQAAKEHEDKYGEQVPHYAEPEGTGESQELFMEGEPEWDGPLPDPIPGWDKAFEDYEQDHGRERDDIEKVAEGTTQDPYSEADTTEDPEVVEPGTWTMSSEELQSRLDAEYSRGFDAAQGRQITRRTLRAKALELVSQDTLRTFAAGEATPTRFDKVFGDDVDKFVQDFARSLGFKVVD